MLERVFVCTFFVFLYLLVFKHLEPPALPFLSLLIVVVVVVVVVVGVGGAGGAGVVASLSPTTLFSSLSDRPRLSSMRIGRRRCRHSCSVRFFLLASNEKKKMISRQRKQKAKTKKINE